MTELMKLTQCTVGIICFIMSFVIPTTINASEPCVETDQVACDPVKMRDTLGEINKKSANMNTNMYALFYSGGILSNQLPSPTTFEAQITPDTKVVRALSMKGDTDQSENDSINETSYSLDLLTLRENFYNHNHSNRTTTQKCLREYGYKGKIDGIWGDKTYFALLSYQEPNIELKDNGIFSGIQNIIADFRNCDEILDQIIEE